MMLNLRNIRRDLKKLLCQLRLHSWTKWNKDILTHLDYAQGDDGFYHHFYIEMAERRCKRCLLKQSRKISLN